MPKKVPQDCLDKMGAEWLVFLRQIEPSKQQPKAVTVTASPCTLTFEEIGDVVVTGGTVSAIELSRNGAAFINLGQVSGMFRVTFNDEFRITYTVAPTVKYLQA